MLQDNIENNDADQIVFEPNNVSHRIDKKNMIVLEDDFSLNFIDDDVIR